MRIKQLSNTTINRIAAGEVIERPASVIKELVENAIDAGATKIDITTMRAGKNLITIVDNGVGMAKADLELAVERHTTSKLMEDDIMNIVHLGFRGEALPSIGSISRLSIVTKEKNADIAYKITVEGGIKSDVVQDILNIGTKIEVRDLFFATPARLKFLKTDQTELAACVEVIKKLAMSYPHVAFSFLSQNKSLIKTKAIAITDPNSYKFRIQEILGNSFIENAVNVDYQDSNITINGYISLPTLNKATQQDQYLFVNNRPVRDKLLLTAVRVAYQDYLARDRFPIVVLYLKLDPNIVDVNVHPAKAEVRFHDSTMVRGTLIKAIRLALNNNASFKASSTIAEAAIQNFTSHTPGPSTVDIPNYYKNYDNLSSINNDKNNVFENKIQYTGFSKPIQQSLGNQSSSNSFGHMFDQAAPLIKSTESTTQVAAHNDATTTLPVQNNFPLGAACAHLHENYIISQTTDSIIIVDQHAAHERLIYEKLKIAIDKNGLMRQRLLVPEIIELADMFLADTISAQQQNLLKFGLVIDKFGEKSIIVSETPALLGEFNVHDLIVDLADNLHEDGEHINLTKLIEAVTETFACHNAIRSGRKLNNHEANDLLRQMESTPFSGQCNHGRPTYIELKLKDIEKLFGRT